MTEDRVDPADLSAFWHRLDSITLQMGAILGRSARSPIFTHSHDFSCFVTDAEGRLLAQADGLPIHTGGVGKTVSKVIQAYEGDIERGDVLAANDPYLATGSHLPDIIFISPVYVEHELALFAGIRGHHLDIGGGHAGGFTPQATEIFQEGLRIPPIRIARSAGVQNHVLDLILANVRERVNVRSDMEAKLGAVRRGTELLAELGSNLGLVVLQRMCAAVMDYGEREMRSEIASIPDGRYEAEERMELEDRNFSRIAVTIHINDSDCTIDFTGTDAQIADPRNSPYANSLSAVFGALNTLIDPRAPHNEGTYRCVQVVLPPGTIVNPDEPAPVGTCTWAPGIELMHIIWKALAAAVPERTSCGWGKIIECNLSGHGPDGDHFVAYLHMVSSGQGAMAGLDGLHEISATNCLGSLVLPNLETFELEYPIRFRRQEIREDGCGPGRWRGGCGVVVAIEALTSMTLAWQSETDDVRSAFGLEGGLPAAPNRIRVLNNGTETSDPRVSGTRHMTAGDIVTFEHSGGGGFGPPEERVEEAVLEDLEGGYISTTFARTHYGYPAHS